MLAIRDLHVYYGGIHALNGVSLDVPDGQIISLIGANGAGKSTTLKAIMGLVSKAEGHIYWDDTDITSNLLCISGKFAYCIHGIISTNIEEPANVHFLKFLKKLRINRILQ